MNKYQLVFIDKYNKELKYKVVKGLTIFYVGQNNFDRECRDNKEVYSLEIYPLECKDGNLIDKKSWENI